jgi:hypothetical protein
LDIVFCLISSILSPSCPPLAAFSLLEATELNIYCAVVEFRLFFKNLIVLVFNVVKLFAVTLDSTPPPVKYLTVKVVLEGAIP